MLPITRAEIVDYLTWTDRRDVERPAVLAAKRARRFEIGRLCFLFENRLTIRYQIQEMMRVERIVREAAIEHEIATCNELLGAGGGLRCVLLVGIDEDEGRAERVRRWVSLNEHLYAIAATGERIRPTWDPRQVDAERLSLVQYLGFDLGGVAPVALGCDFPDPEIRGELPLSADQRAALQADLDEP